MIQTRIVYSAPIAIGLLLAGVSGLSCSRKSSSAAPTAPGGEAIERASDAASTSAATSTISANGNRADGRWVYEGTIADRAVLVRVRCAHGACTGKYFYEAIGDALQLAESAPNQFDEHVGVGKQAKVTGHLAFDDAPGGPAWNGTFSVDSKRPSAGKPIVLTRLEPLVADDRNDAGKPAVSRWLPRTFSEKSPKDAECKASVVSFEIVGLADADVEDRINEAFDPENLAKDFVLPLDAPFQDLCGDKGEKCDVTSHGRRLLCRDWSGRSGLFLDQKVKPTLLDDQLLSVRSDYGFDGGGAHPSGGVSGATLNLRNAHVLDARDLLRKPTPEPDWAKFATPSSPKIDADALEPDGDLPLDLGMVPGDHDQPIGDAPQWLDYFLTTNGLELVPNVPEVARVYRTYVQHVPFAKVRSLLAPRGPAAYLYAR